MAGKSPYYRPAGARTAPRMIIGPERCGRCDWQRPRVDQIAVIRRRTARSARCYCRASVIVVIATIFRIPSPRSQSATQQGSTEAQRLLDLLERERVFDRRE